MRRQAPRNHRAPLNSGEATVTGDDIFEVARIAPAGADTVFSLVAMLHPEVT